MQPQRITNDEQVCKSDFLPIRVCGRVRARDFGRAGKLNCRVAESQMPDRYVLILEPLADRPGSVRVPIEVRMRQLLKLALRGFGFKCVDVRTEKTDPTERGARCR